MEKNLLLIWDDTAESLRAFVFDASSEYAAWARASAGLYINSDDIPEDHPLELLSTAIRNDEFTPLETKAALTGPFDEVVICGFAA
jgi:hypothetical protein